MPAALRHTSRRALQRIAAVLLALALALVAVGCEKDARTLVNEGNVAVINKKFDEAVVSFDAALVKEPGNFDAIVGLAETYLRKGDLAKSREYFDKARASELSKAQQQFLNQKLQELLLAESEKLKDSDPKAYEAKLREVIDVKNRGRAADDAYYSLGELYMRLGDDMAKDVKTRDKAVEYYERMKTIRTQPALRKQALDKAKKLRVVIFHDAFKNELDKISDLLKKENRLDEVGGRVKVIAAVEDKTLNPKTDEEKDEVRKSLSRSATIELIRLTYTLSGARTPESVPNKFAFTTAKVEEELIEKGKAQLTVSVTLEEIEKLAYKQIIEPLENEQGKDDGEDKKDGEGAMGDEGEGDKAPEAPEADADAGAAGDAAPAPAPTPAPAEEKPDAGATPAP